MKTYPHVDQRSGRLAGFEINNFWTGLTTIEKLLLKVKGVEAVQKRRLFEPSQGGFHLRFRYHGVGCFVWEPFGDNSRYWIGQEEGAEVADLTPIEAAFRAHRGWLRRLLGR